MKTACEVLKCFLEVAEAARDGEFYVRCAQRKAYLTRDVIDRWHIGKAPTLGQCKAAGLTEAELETVGLYVQRDHGKVMFFRDAMLIPFIENGQIVYLASRRLVDHDPRSGDPLSKTAKTLCLRAPDSNGENGVMLAAGFNIGALNQAESVMLVEGPLDAIACTERRHSAIAMVGKCPRPGLLASLRKATIPIYLALDGTADVTPEERLDLAARVGPECWILELPQGSDPDDMAADDLVALKAGATQCLEAWLKVFRQPPQNWKKNASEAFRVHLRKWLSDSDPAAAGDLRARVCGALGLSANEWEELLLDRKDSPKQRPELSEQDRMFIDSDLKGKLAELQQLEGLHRDEALDALLADLGLHLAAASTVMRERVRGLVCDTLRISKGTYDRGLSEARVRVGLSSSNTGKAEDWMALAMEYVNDLECNGFRLDY